MEASPKTNRWAALDNLRGLTLFLMLPVNAVMDFNHIPAWFKHAPADGLTLADFIMPAFLFAMGISASFSLPRRWQKSPLNTIGHALLRNGLLFAFGTIGFFLVWQQKNWEVLQMLGATGALAFPFLLLPPPAKAGVAALALLVTEVLRGQWFEPWFRSWYESGLGGPAGTIPLVSIVLFASALGDLLKSRDSRCKVLVPLVAGAVLMAAGWGFSWIQPFNKHLLSLSYVVLTTGTASLALGLFSLRDQPIPFLCGLGCNPLLCYMAGGILTLVIRGMLPADLAAPWAWASGVAVLAVLGAATWALDKKGLYLRL